MAINLYVARIDPKGEYEAKDFALVRSMLDEITAVYDYARRSKYAGKKVFSEVATEELHHLGEFNVALIHYYLENIGIGKEFFKGVNEYCSYTGVSKSDPMFAFCKLAEDVTRKMALKGKV